MPEGLSELLSDLLPDLQEKTAEIKAIAAITDLYDIRL
jgi:hypothetical protein